MLDKIKKIRKYILYIIFTNTLFGIIYFLVFNSLVKYSLLWAYLGCLGLIVFGLVIDKSLIKFLAVEGLNKLSEKELKQNKKTILWLTESFVSFKTVLFVFYFFILIISQIINIVPSLVGEAFSKFILANSSGIVLIIAFDRIINQFSKDRKDMFEKHEEFKRYFQENQLE